MKSKHLLQSVKFFYIAIGLLVTLFLSPFYGDAENFYNYRQEFLLGDIDWNIIDNINVIAVSLIYANPLVAVIFNTSILLLFFYILRLHVAAISSQSKVVAPLIFILICPGIVTRFGEPSREYAQSFLLFLLGFFLLKGSKKSLFFLLGAAIFRPVAVPIYLLWSSFYLFFRRFGLKSSIIFAIFIFTLLFQVSDGVQILNRYQEKFVDYSGALVADSNTILNRFFLNIFGDINSFASDLYSPIERLVFFADYIWRLTALYFISKRLGPFGVGTFCFHSLIISMTFPFPHPRYFSSVLFFLLGFAFAKSISPRYMISLWRKPYTF